jgi:uncharacterized iron-regulated membrane protein
MGDVLIAFLCICISCAAVLAGASWLYRVLAALPASRRPATPKRVVAGDARATRRRGTSLAHAWARRHVSRRHHALEHFGG